MVDLALQEFKGNPATAIKATAENVGVSEATAKKIVEITAVFSQEQLIAPSFYLSFRNRPGKTWGG